MAAHPRQVFRFMDLPRELRLMIYEFLPITTRHQTLHVSNPGHVEYLHAAVSLTVVLLESSVQVLRVCRVIRHEALATIELQLQRMGEITPRVMVDSSALRLLVGAQSLLFHLLADWFHTIRGNE
jgi:hypothetical protein